MRLSAALAAEAAGEIVFPLRAYAPAQHCKTRLRPRTLMALGRPLVYTARFDGGSGALIVGHRRFNRLRRDEAHRHHKPGHDKHESEGP